MVKANFVNYSPSCFILQKASDIIASQKKLLRERQKMECLQQEVDTLSDGGLAPWLGPLFIPTGTEGESVGWHLYQRSNTQGNCPGPCHITPNLPLQQPQGVYNHETGSRGTHPTARKCVLNLEESRHAHNSSCVRLASDLYEGPGNYVPVPL